ncbi:hypothetical protein MXB_385, partial [Myxobolus squamalis]
CLVNLDVFSFRKKRSISFTPPRICDYPFFNLGDTANRIKRNHKKFEHKLGPFSDSGRYSTQQVISLCNNVLTEREEELFNEYSRLLDDIVKGYYNSIVPPYICIDDSKFPS